MVRGNRLGNQDLSGDLLLVLVMVVERGHAPDPAPFAIFFPGKLEVAALQQDGKLGVIAEGAAADLIFLDLDEPSLFPYNNIISSLCYSANGSEVASVMINGKLVMKDREMLTIDAQRVYAEVTKVAEKYLR